MAIFCKNIFNLNLGLLIVFTWVRLVRLISIFSHLKKERLKKDWDKKRYRQMTEVFYVISNSF